MAEPLGNGRWLLSGTRDSAVGIRRLAYAVSDGARTWVFIDGRTYVVDAGDRDGAVRTHVTADQVALSSPMPATVVAISVAPGQEVKEGDLLVMLEAMKMEMPIKAPRDGRVKALACAEGELVQPGVPLLEME